MGSVIPKEIKYNLHCDGVRGDTLCPLLPTKRLSKTRIRLRVRAVWSESSMGADVVGTFFQVTAYILLEKIHVPWENGVRHALFRQLYKPHSPNSPPPPTPPPPPPPQKKKKKKKKKNFDVFFQSSLFQTVFILIIRTH